MVYFIFFFILVYSNITKILLFPLLFGENLKHSISDVLILPTPIPDKEKYYKNSTFSLVFLERT